MSSGEPLIRIVHLTYKPFGAKGDVLKDINLEVFKGDFILLLGSSGSGKSTLTSCFNGLIPHLVSGEMRGNVETAGKDTREHKIHEFAMSIGMVFQNPDDQIVSLRVVDEVAWGVENLGFPHDEVVHRVDRFMHLLEIEELKNRLTFAISGGQKQKVSIASNLAMLQEILVLDDPTTDLDPICKGEVIQTLEFLHRDMGITLIVIEHDLDKLIELANRVVIMDEGCVILDGSPEEIFTLHYDRLLELGINIPQHVEIAHAVLRAGIKQGNVRLPVHKEDGFTLLEEFVMDSQAPEPVYGLEIVPPAEENQAEENQDDPAVCVRGLEFSYVPGVKVIKGIDLDIYPGEIVAIVGANGSGKSTLVSNLVGLLHPDEGTIFINGLDTRKTRIDELGRNIGVVFQDPDSQLFKSTTADEVGFSLRQSKIIPAEEVEYRIDEVLKIVGLSGLRERHPFSLSRGQRQKLAVATALIHKPSAILLDEPTTGQDRQTLAGLMDLLCKLSREGKTIIMVTHDMDLVAAYAARMLVMIDGKIALDGKTNEIFYDHYDTLATMRLRPPTIINFCRRLENYGMARHMTVEPLCEWIGDATKRKTIIGQ